MRISSRKAAITAALVVLTAGNAAGQQISSGCSRFLQDLDSDSTIKSCAQPLLTATASFDPTSNGGAATPSLSSITDTLKQLCSSQTSFCSTAVLSATLNMFSGNCTAELTGPSAVPAVLALYDSLYIVTPLKAAICSTDPTTSDSCLLEIAAGTTTGKAEVATGSAVAASGSANATVSAAAPSGNIGAANTSFVALASKQFDIASFAKQALNPVNLFQAASSLAQGARRVKRQAETTTTTGRGRGAAAASASASASASAGANNASSATAAQIVIGATVPNTTTFTDSYLHFLFLSPAMPSSMLCTSCTKAVMAAYIKWESQQTYAAGLANSPLLNIQLPLWKALGGTCGDGFISGINTLAGQTSLDNGASSLAGKPAIIALSILLTSYLLL